MKRGLLWTLLIVLVLVKFLLLTELYFTGVEMMSPTEECKIIQQSREGSVNILFFAEEEETKKYSDFLLDTYPFNQSKNKFDIYYIDTYNPECKLYKETAILCHSKELIRKAASCPSDYIVVLKDEKRSIRSSSYMNVLSINSAQPLSVFTHEFGHSFANLADEYTPAKLPRAQENCKEDCLEFEGQECFSGCSKDSYFRSFNNGLMKTLSAKDYGPFDSGLISKKIGINPSPKTTGSVIQEPIYCSMQRYYLMEGKYNSGEIEITSQSIQVGCPGNNGDGAFEYKMIMENGAKLSNNFNPEIVFTDNEAGGEVYEYSGEFYLKIPVIETARAIEISLDDKILSQINLIEVDSLPCEI